MKRLVTIFGLCAALFVTGLFATKAAAEIDNCAPRESVIARLADKYGETRKSVGLGNEDAVVEVFASKETGTWTITLTTASGLTCLVASGQAFEELAEVLPATGKDA